MTERTVAELHRADIELAGYREFLREQHLGQAASRWPLIVAVDQFLMADRWRRQLVAARPAAPSNVTPLPHVRPATRTADWFHATEIL